MAQGSFMRAPQLNTVFLIVGMIVVLTSVRPSVGSALRCNTCVIDDDLLLQKSWVCGECGAMYSNRIEHCCFCDKEYYKKCLVATGIDRDKDTDLHRPGPSFDI